MGSPAPSAAPAAELADMAVAAVRDDPAARLRLMRSLYVGDSRTPHLAYRRAMTAFMRWQLRRGLLAPADAPAPGSAWWRAVNERLVRDIAEARRLTADAPGEPSSASVGAVVEFIHRPSASNWYRAHNAAIVGGYLAHRDLAEREDRAERFFINVVLLRVLYAHALVAAPRLALGRLAPAARILGDPRLGMTGIFLSLSRVLPHHYPLGEEVAPFVAEENGFGRALDVGIIQPRLERLYEWSARELAIPELAGLLVDGIPAYAWDPTDRVDWLHSDGRLAGLARRRVPAGEPAAPASPSN
jgi:hypothetical protein